MTITSEGSRLRRWSKEGGLLRRHRDYRLLWAGQITGKYGDCVASVSLPLVAVRLHASSFEVGALAAVIWLPWLVVGLPAGVLVDRWRRRNVMMTASGVSGVLFAAVPVAAWCGALSYGMLLLVALLTGVCAVFFQTAYGAYVQSILRPEDRAEGNATLAGATSAAQIAGLGSGGLIAAAFGAVGGLLANAATFAVSFLGLAGIRQREPRPSAPANGPKASMGRQIREGLSDVFGDPWLRAGILWGATANFALTGYDAIVVIFLVRDVGFGAGAVGLLMAASGVGGIAGAFVARAAGRRFGTARAFLVGAVGVNGLALLMPLATRGWGAALYAIGSFCVAAGVGGGNVLWATFAQGYYPPEAYGRMSASGSVLNYGLMPLGALIGGALASSLGLRDAMWITTAAIPVTGILLLCSPMARHRDLPGHRLGEAPPPAAPVNKVATA